MLKNKRGIVLITTMLTVVLVIMLLSSVVYSNLGSMRLASNFYGREQALMAAQSGVQYAITKLQNNITWKGCDESETISDSSKGLSVMEKNGNVVGMLDSKNGRRSFFRIKFNYEDGDNGFDGLNDSSSSDKIPSPYVSVNNLFSSTSTKVYTASKEGSLTLKSYKDEYGKNRQEAENSSSFVLEKSSCYLVVEGFAGDGVRDLSLENMLNMPKDRCNAACITVESYLGLAADEQFTDSVACAANDLKTTSSILRVDNAKGGSAPKIRTLKNLTVQSEKIDFANGQFYYGKDCNYTINGQAIDKDATYKAQSSSDSDNFAQILWDDITKANSPGQEYEKLEAGTYVWSVNPETKKNVLKRYQGNYPPGEPIPADAKSVTITSLPGMTIDNDTQTMKISKNLLVVADGKDSSFIVRYDKDSGASRPIVALLENSNTKTSPIISSSGDIFLQAATLGGGSITSEGNISLQGPSILESDPGVGVSIYSKKDVNLLPIEDLTTTVKDTIKPTNPPAADNNGTTSGSGTTGESGTKQVYVFKSSTDYEDLRSEIFNDIIASLQYQERPPRPGQGPFGPEGNPPSVSTGLFQEQSHIEAAKEIFDKFCDYRKTMVSAFYNDIGEVEPWDSDWTENPAYNGCNTMNKTEADKLSTLLYSKSGRLDLYLWNIDNWELITQPTGSTEADTSLSPSDINNVQDCIDKDLATDNFRDNKEAQLADLLTRYGNLKYSDQDISGVIYAWGNINADIGQNSTLNLTGAMVAYGANPKTKTPGKDNKGTITINAGSIGMTLDPDYMGAFLSANARRKLKVTMFSSF
ncbi:MAG: pilus assembly PilX N-terminal domain-containing protein [Candidatus Bruticola sp.]